MCILCNKTITLRIYWNISISKNLYIFLLIYAENCYNIGNMS